jgi:flavorubredoxin
MVPLFGRRDGREFRSFGRCASLGLVPTLLLVHHTTSPATHALFRAVLEGATDPSIAGVSVVARAALATTASDALEADGFLLGTPANLGYISGALKHFFDQIYYPCIEHTRGLPYGLYVHANNDATGAIRAVETITTGLQWRQAQPHVVARGEPATSDLEACWELGAALSATLAANR